MEWMFAPNWSAKAEYLYYDLGNSNSKMTMIGYDSADAGSDAYFNGSSTTFTSRFNGNVVRAGVNYHFNLANVAPVVAKF
jgi:outer membrane immunogenic protein